MKIINPLYLTCFLLIIHLIPSSAQQTFFQSFGVGNGVSEPYELIPTSDGGALIMGSNFTTLNIDLYLIKLDAAGKEEWSLIQDFDVGAIGDLAVSAVETNEYFHVLCFSKKLGETTVNPLLIKMDKNLGELLSCKVLHEFEGLGGLSKMIQSTDGNLVCLGKKKTITDIGGYQSTALVKLDMAGNVIWIQPYGESVAHMDYYFGGLYEDVINQAYYFSDGGFSSTSQPVSPFQKLVLGKSDEEGNSIWIKNIANTGAAISIGKLSDALVVPTGFSNGDQSVLFKFSLTGELLWKKSYKEHFNQSDFHCTTSPSDEIIIAGNKGQDAILMKTDSEGEIIWKRTIEHPLGYRLFNRAIVLSENGSIMVTGYLNTGTGDSPRGIFIFRVNEDGEFDVLDTNENIDLPTFEIDVFPNPTTSRIAIQEKSKEKTRYQITLFDATGRRLYETQMTDKQHEINMSHLANGMYILQLRNAKNQLYQKSIVKQ